MQMSTFGYSAQCVDVVVFEFLGFPRFAVQQKKSGNHFLKELVGQVIFTWQAFRPSDLFPVFPNEP